MYRRKKYKSNYTAEERASYGQMMKTERQSEKEANKDKIFISLDADALEFADTISIKDDRSLEILEDVSIRNKYSEEDKEFFKKIGFFFNNKGEHIHDIKYLITFDYSAEKLAAVKSLKKRKWNGYSWEVDISTTIEELETAFKNYKIVFEKICFTTRNIVLVKYLERYVDIGKVNIHLASNIEELEKANLKYESTDDKNIYKIISNIKKQGERIMTTNELKIEELVKTLQLTAENDKIYGKKATKEKLEDNLSFIKENKQEIIDYIHSIERTNNRLLGDRLLEDYKLIDEKEEIYNACLNRDLKKLKELIEDNIITVNHYYSFNRHSLLEHILFCPNNELIDFALYMIKKGAHINMLSLFSAARYMSDSQFQEALSYVKNVDITSGGFEENTALMYIFNNSLYYCMKSKIEMLIQAGANINHVGKREESVLMIAMKNDSVHAARFLTEKGAV